MLKTTTKKVVILLGDIVILYFSLRTALWIRYQNPFFGGNEPEHVWDLHKIPFLLVFLLWIFIFYSSGMYDWERFGTRASDIAQRIVKPMLVGSALAVLLFYFIPSFNSQSFKITPKTNLIIVAIIATLLLALWRIIFAKTIVRGSKVRVLFLGYTEEIQNLAKYLSQNPFLGYETLSVMNQAQFKEQDLKTFLVGQKVNLVVIEPSVLRNQELVRAFYEILPFGTSIISFPAFYASITGKIPTSLITETWFLENLIELNKRTFEVSKRLLDILFVVLLGIPAFVISVFIALGITLSTPNDVLHHRERRARPGDGIVLFRQKRVGKNGKTFDFIKFRSQILGAEKMGDLKELKAEHDPRQYPFGKFLRKTYLDEIPQLLNVLKGEMSLVGPRPERPEYVAELKKSISFYEIRHLVRPGITGWAQINMHDDASVEDAPEKLQYDLFYIQNRSLLMDLAIAAKTATILARRTGR